MKDNTGVWVDRNALWKIFEDNAPIRLHVVNDLKERIEQTLSTLHTRPAVKVRIKSFYSYYKKYLRLLKNGNSAACITDLMGLRIVCPFIEDLGTVEGLIKGSFEVLEVDRKGHYTFKEFGYESTHLLIRIPDDIIALRGRPDCDVAEIQIRTILQDAWAEVEHELYYKAEFNPVDEPMKRKLAAVNASLTLADIIFQEVRVYQRQLNGELGKRRESFFQKIEQSTDALLFADEEEIKPDALPEDAVSNYISDSVSIDDLLLSALSAHNKNRFNDAIALYSRILDITSEKTVCSLIYKHRGMAHFACSQYDDAINDFTFSLELDEKSYKAAYYRGVVYSVLKKYSQAIDDFTRSLSINPYQPFCLFRRGQAYYHIGDFPQALSDCEASIALAPQNETVLKFRELLKEKLSM